MTNTTKHTPGPWERPNWEKCGIYGPKNAVPHTEEPEKICHVNINSLEYEANARLIAAAPELLEACNKAMEAALDKVVMQAIKDGTLLEEEMHAGLCLLGFIRRKYLKTYEQAIAKAEGR